MKAIKVYKKTQDLRAKQDEIPWSVRRLFREGHFEIEIIGELIGFGEDYVSISEAREAFEWIVDQLDGDITWK